MNKEKKTNKNWNNGKKTSSIHTIWVYYMQKPTTVGVNKLVNTLSYITVDMMAKKKVFQTFRNNNWKKQQKRGESKKIQ